MKHLITADWHLRETVPSCVNANQTEWMNIQREAVSKVAEIAIENNVVAVFVGGDIFHSDASTSFACIQIFQDFACLLNKHGIAVYILAGNHDLQQHSSSNLDISAIGVLLKSKYILNMSDCDFCKGCNFDIEDYGDSEVIFKHTLTMPKDVAEANPFVKCETPESLLEKYPSAKYIYTGDYHKNFSFEENGRRVINSGCLTIQASDMIGYETGVYVVDTENDSVSWFKVSVSQKFIENNKKEKTDKSIDDFVNGIQKSTVTLDFINTLRNEIPKQKEPVQKKVECWIEEIGQ